MVSKLNNPAIRLFAIGIVVTLLSGVGWWFGTALQPQWWVVWLAPLPVMAFALHVRPITSALAAFIAFAIGGLNWWPYLHEAIGLPIGAIVGAIVVPAFSFALTTLLFQALARRGYFLAAMFSAPAMWTALGYIASLQSPHGTFGNVAYTQMDALPVIQIASVAGLWGIGFVVWLLPSALALLFSPATRPKAPGRVIAIGLTIIGLSAGFGVVRLQTQNEGSGTTRIGLLSIGTSKKASASLANPEGETLLRRYTAEMKRLAESGAQIIIAPESSLLVTSHTIPELEGVATRLDTHLLIGVEDRSEPNQFRNAALVFEPKETTPTYCAKQHLIPGFEDRYRPGSENVLLRTDRRIGIAICKDLDFTQTAIDYNRLGTQLLLVPAWDFDVDAWMHSRMAVLRGVEGGFAVARSTRDGLLTVSNAYGQVLAEGSSIGNREVVSLVTNVPIHKTRTWYALIGDSFAWICIALTAGALLLVFLVRHEKTLARNINLLDIRI